MKRDLRIARFLALLVVAVTSALYACAPSAEELRQDRAKQYLNQIAVTDFVRLRTDYGQNAYGIYFGPLSLDPSTDISGPGLLLAVPPSLGTHYDSIYDTVADGYGVAADGERCFVIVNRSREGRLLDYWRLTKEQTQLVAKGTHVVLEIGVVCGEPL